jgi:hypothetical protein
VPDKIEFMTEKILSADNHPEGEDERGLSQRD